MMDQAKEVKWSLQIGQYKIEEPTLQSIKVRVENQLPRFNQFVEELLNLVLNIFFYFFIYQI